MNRVGAMAAVVGVASIMTFHANAALAESSSSASMAYYDEEVWGLGTSQPLIEALRGIAGRDVQVVIDDSLTGTEKVTWQGRRARGQLLDELLAPLGMGWAFDQGTLFVRPEHAIRATKVLSTPFEPAPTGTHAAPASELEALPVVDIDTMPAIAPIDAPLESAAPSKDTNISNVADVASPKQWEIIEGQTARDTLQRWGERAGWGLSWEAGEDVAYDIGARIEGDFEDVVLELLQASEPVKYMKAFFYDDQRVVVIREIRSGF